MVPTAAGDCCFRPGWATWPRSCAQRSCAPPRAAHSSGSRTRWCWDCPPCWACGRGGRIPACAHGQLPHPRLRCCRRSFPAWRVACCRRVSQLLAAEQRHRDGICSPVRRRRSPLFEGWHSAAGRTATTPTCCPANSARRGPSLRASTCRTTAAHCCCPGRSTCSPLRRRRHRLLRRRFLHPAADPSAERPWHALCYPWSSTTVSHRATPTHESSHRRFSV